MSQTLWSHCEDEKQKTEMQEIVFLKKIKGVKCIAFLSDAHPNLNIHVMIPPKSQLAKFLEIHVLQPGFPWMY